MNAFGRHNYDVGTPKFKYSMAIPCFGLLCFTIVILPGLWREIRKFPHNELYIFATSLILFIGSGFCLFLKFLFSSIDKDVLTSKQKKCRRDLLTGYIGLVICGFIPQLTALSVGWNKDWGKATIYSSVVIANLFPMLLYPLFIIEHLKYYKINNKWNLCKQRWLVILAHVGFSVTVSTIAYNFGNEEYHGTVTCFTLFYTMMFSSITAEWFVVWKNGIWIKKNRWMVQDPVIQTVNILIDEELSERVSVDPSELEAASRNPFKCHICFSPYSNLITPRMLVGCGHTVCEECVAKLPRNEQYTAQVICPFCRKPTRMPCGLPSELPKNYAAFGGSLVDNTDKLYVSYSDENKN